MRALGPVSPSKWGCWSTGLEERVGAAASCRRGLLCDQPHSFGSRASNLPCLPSTRASGKDSAFLPSS